MYNIADLLLLLARLTIGLGVASHGAQKLFGWFGGGGMQGTTGYLASLGLRPSGALAQLAGWSEFAGGILLALGALNPLGPVLVLGVMITAMLTQHRGKGFFNSKGGIELPAMVASAAVLLAFMGPGPGALGTVGWLGEFRVTFWLVILAIVGGFVVAFGLRSAPPPPQP